MPHRSIGYGPEPAACVKYMREFADINLMGNHEAMYLATRPNVKQQLKPEELGDLWPRQKMLKHRWPARSVRTAPSASMLAWISEMTAIPPVDAGVACGM